MNQRGFLTTDVGRISYVKKALYGDKGKYRVNFSLTKTENIKDSEGYKKVYTNIQAVIFGLSEKQADLLKDGSIIHYIGRVSNNEYNGKKYISIFIEEYRVLNVGGVRADDTDFNYPQDDTPPDLAF